MDNTNLLPPARRRSLARDAVLRIVVVAVAMLTALVLAAGALLVPSYVFLESSANTKKERLATVDTSFSSSDEAALTARLTVLSKNAARLVALSKASSVSGIVQTILAVSRTGITLTNFTYSPGAGASPANITVSGSAATRDALRNYQLALQSAPFVRTATLPVSAYAKDTDIDFAITITLAP